MPELVLDGLRHTAASLMVSTSVPLPPDSLASLNSWPAVRYVRFLRLFRGVSTPSQGFAWMRRSATASSQIPRRMPRLQITTVALFPAACAPTHSWISLRDNDPTVQPAHRGTMCSGAGAG